MDYLYIPERPEPSPPPKKNLFQWLAFVLVIVVLFTAKAIFDTAQDIPEEGSALLRFVSGGAIFSIAIAVFYAPCFRGKRKERPFWLWTGIALALILLTFVLYDLAIGR